MLRRCFLLVSPLCGLSAVLWVNQGATEMLWM